MVNDEFSAYKSHSAWFSQRASGGHGAPVEDYWSRRAQSAWDSKLPAWECAGPFNVAGRVTSLLVHPRDSRRMWAGAAAGGVWVTSDGGAGWRSCWPCWASPNIGALAFDASDPDVIYCATGEANISPDCYPGNGLYISRDGGGTWNSEPMPRITICRGALAC